MELMKKFINDEAGQGMAEYGLLLAAVVIIVIAAKGFLSEGMTTLFTNIKTRLQSAISAT